MKKIKIILLLLCVSFASFSQNPSINGYKGIWFTLGQFSEYGDKYSGGLGTYTADHIPIAIYSPEAKKTFFTYGGTTAADKRHLLIMISYYDHMTGKVPRPVVVYDKNGVDDPHDNASLSIDNEGFIWVFVSGRSKARPGFIFKSAKPLSIEKFEMIREGEMTYPQPWWVKDKGFLYLFTKYTKGRELYWSTSKNGFSWAPDQKLAGMGGHYQVTNMTGDKLVSVFNYHPGGNVDRRTNIYCVQTSDMGKTWTTIDGKVIRTPLSDSHNEALIRDYESEKKLVYINDLNFDSRGNPVILAVISNDFKPGPGGDPREWTIIHWKNGKWNFSKVCISTHNYDMGSLYTGKKSWTIIGPTEAGPQYYGAGGEIAMWNSTDEGNTWKKVKTLTSGSPRNHSYVRRPLLPQNDFYAFWADGDADKLSESHLYYSDIKGNVYELPFDMKDDTATPVRVVNKNTVRQNTQVPKEPDSNVVPGSIISGEFNLKINGKDTPLQQYKTYSYAHLISSRAFQVTIASSSVINEIKVSPARYEIKPAAGKSSSSFVLPAPGYYSIKINGSRRIFIFADVPEDPGSDTVNITKFLGNGRIAGQVITGQLQAAINKMAGSGKVLYFPAGAYTTGSVSIPSGSNIYLASGALIKATDEISAFDFHDNIKPRSFLRIKDASDVTIRGMGTIDANGRFLRDKYADSARMRLILVLNSRDITLEGITVRDPGSWNTHILFSENVSVRNIKMLNDIELSNTDGFDPDASRNVLIENCFAYCSDDNVAIKTTGSSGYLRDLENITVRGCVFLTKKSSLKVGTESRAAVMKNIIFENNDVVECDRGMSLYCSDGATFSGITYSGNRFEDWFPDSKQSFLNFTITKRNPGSSAGMISNVLIKDCSFEKPFPKKSEILGFDSDHTISVTFRNFFVAGGKCNNLSDAFIKQNEFSILTFE